MDMAIIWTAIGTAITVVATGIATVGLVYTFLRNFKQDINCKIEKLDSDVKSQTCRTDQLYSMFIDVQREIQSLQKGMDQKFYALLKEKHEPGSSL